MHLARTCDPDCGYLCTPQFDFAQISIASGISVTSAALPAHTIHALSHFASKEWNFDSVAVDIACT